MRLLGASEKTITRWIEEDGLPAFRLNNQYHFNRVEVLEWASTHEVNVSPQVLHQLDAQEMPLPSLAEALEAGGLFYRVPGADKNAVLQAVVESLPVPDSVDREHLLQVLLEREAMGSTSVGDGIAIPHVRNPIVLHVDEPMVTLSFLEHPIEFGALDGKPVDTLFTLISPTIRVHLHVLSVIAFALHDKDFKAAIQRQAKPDVLLAEARRVGEPLSAKPDDLGKTR